MYVDQIRGCSLARSGSARSAESIRRLDSIQSSFNNPKYIYTRFCIITSKRIQFTPAESAGYMDSAYFD